MNVFASPRGSGRTTQAIEWLRRDPEHRVLVVKDAKEAYRLHIQYDLPEKCFWTFDDIVSHRAKWHTGKRIIMDNADNFFEYWMQRQLGPGNQLEAVIFEDTSDKLLTAEEYDLYRRIQNEKCVQEERPYWLRDISPSSK